MAHLFVGADECIDMVTHRQGLNALVFFFVMTSTHLSPTMAVPAHSRTVDTDAPTLQSTSQMKTVTCGELCSFSERYNIAHCENRALKHVPISDGCEGAYTLELQDNKINQLTPGASLLGYELVRTLDINRNYLTIVSCGTFATMANLKSLFIISNLLEVIESFTFMGTEGNLQRVYLNNNNIRIIRENAFRNLSKVHTVYLSYNIIEFLHESAFQDMDALRYLYLNTNNLQHISGNTFKGLKALEEIRLDGNRLQSLPL